MKKILYLFVLVTSLSMMSSCNDDDNGKSTTIEVKTPTDMQVYKPLENVIVRYYLKDKSGIYQYNIEVMNEQSEDVGFYIKKEFGFDYLINEFNDTYSFTVPKTDRQNNALTDGVYDIKFTVLNRSNVKTTFIRKIKIENPIK